MKFILSLILFCALALGVQAQFVQINPPACVSAFTNGIGVVVIAGSSTSNLPTAMVTVFPVGRTGFGFGVNHAGTNAATTTNAIYTFEVTANQTDYIQNNRPVVSFPQLGTGYSAYYTNIAETSASLGNAYFVRMRSIQNTNIDSLFITNTCLNTR